MQQASHNTGSIQTYLLISLIILAGCGLAACAKRDSTIAIPKAENYPIMPKNNIESPPPRPSWAYWLQKTDLSKLAASSYPLAVIDYSADGSDPSAYKVSDLAAAKKNGMTLLAYFSIGEFEDYRFYAPEVRERSPEIIGPENPDWPGNRKVQYWDDKWWEYALRPYLDKIIAAGFDGVYLDIIDAYWFWGEQEQDVRTYADRMCSLVLKIKSYGSRHAGRFLVVPQNGLGILRDASPGLAKRYAEAMYGFGLESLFFNTYSDEDAAYRRELVLNDIPKRKSVFVIEYITPEQYPDFLQKIASLGRAVIPYASTPDRSLDTLTPRSWLNTRSR